MQNYDNNNELVPCDNCNNMIPFDEYVNHANVCTNNNNFVDIQVHDMNDFTDFINTFANITDQLQLSNNNVSLTNMNIHINNSNYHDTNSNILHYFVNMLPFLINVDSLNREDVENMNNHIINKESCYTVVSNQNDNTCIICLEDGNNSNLTFVKTECGHIYCKTCIDKWLSINDRCPLCMHQFEDQGTTSLEDV